MKLKILTYNIHKGISGFGRRYTLEIIKNAIQDTDCNICFLQEVIGENKNLKSGHIENQFEYLADKVWSYYSYGKNASYPKGDHGNAILSSLPIHSEHNLNLSVNKYEQRGLLHIQVQDPVSLSTIHLLNTHLNLRNPDRLKQFLSIQNYINSNINASAPLILCGDFNDWNIQIHNLLKTNLNLKEAYEEVHQKLPKTFPSLYPVAKLDRIYSRNLVVHSANTLKGDRWALISDHLPIFAEFNL